LISEVAFRQLGSANAAQQNSMEKLSSGLRINGAKDDAAGLAISEKMRGQIRGLDMAAKNSQDAISMIQTAEGALNETHAILQRMRELAVQGANDTNVDQDRDAIQEELNELKKEIDRIGETTEFNKQTLLNGGLGGTVNQDATTTTALAVTGVATVQTNGAAADTYSICKYINNDKFCRYQDANYY
jgi:flagellin